MSTLLADFALESSHLRLNRDRQLLEPKVMSRSMHGKHTCPLCAYALLRHMRVGGLYWRCSHCYDEMPIL